MKTMLLLIILSQPNQSDIILKVKWETKSPNDCLKIAHSYFNKTVPYELGGTLTFNAYCLR